MRRKALLFLPLLVLIAPASAFGGILANATFHVDQFVPIDPNQVACSLPNAAIITCPAGDPNAGKQCYPLTLHGDVHAVLSETVLPDGTCNSYLTINYENMHGMNVNDGTPYRLMGNYHFWLFDSTDCSLAAIFGTDKATRTQFFVRLRGVGPANDLILRGEIFLTPQTIPGQGPIKFDNWINFTVECNK